MKDMFTYHNKCKTIKIAVQTANLKKKRTFAICYICNKDNDLTFKILKAYLTAGNRFKSARVFCLNPTSNPAINCVQNSKRSENFLIYCENGRTGCRLPEQIHDKIIIMARFDFGQ